MTRISLVIVAIFSIFVWGISMYTYIAAPLNVFNSYATQNILINYSSGFIRRGLLGEIFKQLHLTTDLNILIIIKYFCLSNYLIFCTYLLTQFFRKNISPYLLLMPYVLPYYSLVGIIDMRDFFLINLFTISLILLKHKTNFYGRIILLNMITIIGILTHEIYFFISIPIFISIFCRQFSGRIVGNLIKISLYFAPAFFALLLSVRYHGNTDSVSIIYADIISILPPGTKYLEIGAGLLSMGDTAELHVTQIFTEFIWNGFSRGVHYIIYILLLIFILSHIDKLKLPLFSKKIKGNLSPSTTSGIFIFQIICLLPIFLVAIDWQRWISLALYTSLVFSVNCGNLNLPFFDKQLKIVRNLYSFFLNPTTEVVYIIATFCLAPYISLGNTPYQFSNIFLMMDNYTARVIDILLR